MCKLPEQATYGVGMDEPVYSWLLRHIYKIVLDGSVDRREAFMIYDL
jgi:hypothetical protein